jgi:adenylosuccinate synthase
MPGWKCKTSGAKSFKDLPTAAKNYVRRIEQLVGVPIAWVGIGHGRNDMVTRGFVHSG